MRDRKVSGMTGHISKVSKKMVLISGIETPDGRRIVCRVNTKNSICRSKQLKNEVWDGLYKPTVIKEGLKLIG